MRQVRRWQRAATPGIRFCLLLVLAILGTVSCRGIEADTLYARRLPGPPEDADWETAIPLRVLVSGGAVHSVRSPLTVQAVDQDTVHRNSASCHHGPLQKTAIPVWLRAYRDGQNIYLRLTWPDQTPDPESRRWVGERGSWRLEGGEGDGVALIFPAGPQPDFTCSLVCHLDDWAVEGGRFLESAKMRFAGDGLADIWLWRASDRVVGDLLIDGQGIRPRQARGEIRIKNSRLAHAGDETGAAARLALNPGDEPWADAAGNPLAGVPGSAQRIELPTYLPLPDWLRRGTIRSVARYRRGFWEITLTRPLDTGKRGDIVFVGGKSYAFSLSVMDNTLRNHHITDAAWRLKVVS